MPTDETQMEEQENTQPLVTSNEEVDGLIGEMFLMIRQKIVQIQH